MKYLGIDYGTKKVGLALSDDEGRLAFPHDVIPNDTLFSDAVHQLITEKNVGAVVLGHSLSQQGSENPVMDEIHVFKDGLEKNGMEVHLEPEYYTSVQAKRSTEDAQADSAAAALILQSFIDKMSSE